MFAKWHCASNLIAIRHFFQQKRHPKPLSVSSTCASGTNPRNEEVSNTGFHRVFWVSAYFALHDIKHTRGWERDSRGEKCIQKLSLVVTRRCVSLSVSSCSWTRADANIPSYRPECPCACMHTGNPLSDCQWIARFDSHFRAEAEEAPTDLSTTGEASSRTVYLTPQRQKDSPFLVLRDTTTLIVDVRYLYLKT